MVISIRELFIGINYGLTFTWHKAIIQTNADIQCAMLLWCLTYNYSVHSTAMIEAEYE